MCAVEKGLVDCVKELNDAGADVKIINENGVSSLMFALCRGHVDCVKELIDAGADVNVKQTVLRVASGTGDVENIEPMSSVSDMSPLMLASDKGNVDLVKMLISAGTNVNMTDSNGASPLIFATAKGHINCLQKLIAVKGEVNHEDEDGITAFALAVHYDHIECSRELLTAGADVNVRCIETDQPLIKAVNTGRADYIAE